ncbi:NTP transferase domain-containing protein [Aliivibrio sp. SR45-2]|uniref:nucleotidyltransferase family protein n=1 Tax=Aliivibrio sp. SR45-2 TaxID=2760931 RepID=UPI0015FBD5E9|nr:nucleotidyltransferase family protein [Aliivibrio sp. SR45-2]MBB1312045.1 nucleotidyltransferase family protein [Aliivibrio sp. SR45-2]
MARFPRHIGLLLAAGWSTRFNGDKRLAGATPLLMQTYAVMKEHFDLVVVVHRHHDEMIKSLFIDQKAELVAAPNDDISLGTSISVGSQYVNHKYCDSYLSISVCLADMPNIKDDSYRSILSMAQKNKIVRPNINGCFGHPVCFGSSYLNALCLLTGEKGASSVIKKNRANLMTVEVDDIGILFDIDTPEDLQEWQRTE